MYIVYNLSTLDLCSLRRQPTQPIVSSVQLQNKALCKVHHDFGNPQFFLVPIPVNTTVTLIPMEFTVLT